MKTAGSVQLKMGLLLSVKNNQNKDRKIKTKEFLEETDKQSDEQVHKARSRSTPSAGALVPIEP